ncbi:MAG: glycosyltransferase family 2 protein [Candidatus Omnitrophota bacterium]
MRDKKVSLYIPCYNAQATIQYCLEAVFKQRYPLKEVVVVDDGCNDKTFEIASGFPVRIIRHDKNKGLAASRNTAVKNIDAEFIASLDADCLPKAEWLENLMKRFDSSKVAGAGGKLLENNPSTVFDLWRSVRMKQYWENGQTAPPFLFGSNTAFRKEALINIGLYNEDYKNNYEDVDICDRLKGAGYSLVYEPKALACHLKSDNICSIMDSYWRWNLGYYQKKDYYSTPKNFVFKLKDNLGLGNRYLEEDMGLKRYDLLYLDFLLSLHHCLYDFEYFISLNKHRQVNFTLLSFWLSLVDLTFYYHFDFRKNNLSTFMPPENAFLQNYFVLNLILGRSIQEKFRSKKFQKILYKHLLLSVYKINDTYLLDKLTNLIELHPDWSGFLKKKHPNLNIVFLDNLSLIFQKWLESLMYNYPKIIQAIEASAEKTDALSLY